MTKRHLSILLSAIALSSCQNEPVLLKALNYDVGPPPQTANLKLNGISMEARGGWGMTAEQGEAFLRQHQRKTVNYYGIVYDIKVRGNRAGIEIVPQRTGSMQQNCTVRELLRRYGGHNCDQEKTRSFTTVICHVDNWAALNQKTQGLLLGNLKTRKDDYKKWDTVHIEGKLTNLKPATRKVGFYDGGVNLQFGTGGGFYTKTWVYEAFIVEGCRVRGFDHQIL